MASIRTQIRTLAELKSHLPDLGTTPLTFIDPKTTAEDIDFEDNEAFKNNHPNRRAYFLSLIFNGCLGAADVCIQKFNFSLTDDYIIYHALTCLSYRMIQTLIDFGFKFTTDLINPFLLCIFQYNNGTQTIISDPRVTPLSSTYQVGEIERIFDVLIKNGYDLHMDNDMAFEFCLQSDILTYFVKSGTDVRSKQLPWITHYINFFRDSLHFPLESINLLITHGMELDIVGGHLVSHAIHTANAELMDLLTTNHYDIKPALRAQIKDFGKIVKRCMMYTEDQILKLINYLIDTECDLKLMNPLILQFLVMRMQYKPLQLLMEHGIDVVNMIKKSGMLADSTNVRDHPMCKTIKLLIDNGLELEEVLYFMFPHTFNPVFGIKMMN